VPSCPFGVRDPAERLWRGPSRSWKVRVVHVHVSDSSSVPRIERALHRGGCVTDRVGERTIRVVCVHSGDPRQSREELEFFLRAWQRTQPGVVTMLLP
jgi:hypothetical protein